MKNKTRNPAQKYKLFDFKANHPHWRIDSIREDHG